MVVAEVWLEKTCSSCEVDMVWQKVISFCLADAAATVVWTRLPSSTRPPATYQTLTATPLLTSTATVWQVGAHCAHTQTRTLRLISMLTLLPIPDLFLTCRDPADSKRQTYEILINKKDEGFVSKLSGRLPPGAGQVSFADMDRDGTIDMVFPSCSSDGCFINIAYNQQMPLCDAATPSNKESPSTSACRDPTQLCQADPDFKFDLSLTSPSFVQLRLADVLPDRPHLVLSDSSFSGTLPISMKLGDYNQDSFPDILVLSAPHRDPSEGRPTLLQSVPCSTHVCGDQAAKQGRRMFEPVKEKVNVLESIDDAKLASFVDIDEKVCPLDP